MGIESQIYAGNISVACKVNAFKESQVHHVGSTGTCVGGPVSTEFHGVKFAVLIDGVLLSGDNICVELFVYFCLWLMCTIC